MIVIIKYIVVQFILKINVPRTVPKATGNPVQISNDSIIPAGAKASP